MPKLTQNQFYCFSCRKKVTSKSADMCVVVFQNKKIGEVPALESRCAKCETSMYKFIKHKDEERLTKKFGEC